jgi:hypothetical protein
VCAAIAGLTRLIDVPPLGRYLLGGYLILLAIPLVLRLPSLVRNLLGTSADLARTRAELREWVEQRRRDHQRGVSQEGDKTDKEATNQHE